MKILFVAQNLKMGGIQRALVNTIKMMKETHPDADINVFSFADGELASLISEDVSIIYANRSLSLLLTPLDEIKSSGKIFDILVRYLLIISAKLFGTEKVYRYLFKRQKKLCEYDIAISYFNDVFSGISNKGTNLFVSDFVNAGQKIAWIHTDPIKANFDVEKCAVIYKPFDKIVCVSNAIKTVFDEILPVFSDKTCVVYNVFPSDEIIKGADTLSTNFDKSICNLVTVGREDNSTKRIDRALEVCELLKKEHGISFKWRFIGDGPDLEKNKQIAIEKDICDVTEFLGNKNNPYPYVKNSDIFVLTSDYEGYPMVVCEAMILEVPVVTTPFRAAAEIIDDGVNGIIATTSPSDIAKKLADIINNRQTLDAMTSSLKKECSINSLWEEQIGFILG